MSNINELSGEMIRDAIDARDRYELLREAEAELHHSYKGSMRFERRADKEYLVRTIKGSSTQRKSLGVRSPETEQLLKQFQAGKARVQDRIAGLRQQIEDRASVLVARGLGRMPVLPARVIRQIDRAGLLGKHLTILGTNALYAYEAAAGVRIGSDMLATGDVDMLFDARRKLVVGGDVNTKGLIGLLKQVDKTFYKAVGRSYTAANRDGYQVDLIEPQDHARIMREGERGMSDVEGDLVATSTDSSKWLLNVPKFNAVSFDEKGLPVPLVTLDPRVYALQKLWIVENDKSRAPDKRQRDAEQADLVATLAVRHLGLSFDDSALSGLPNSFRELIDKLNFEESSRSSSW
ncbi:nucleotidyltransferase domain-containing protein [uncultured Ruegeria sp.]|uniref:nucleotidyltransferase family protein n=1 Tax=uncultured Ruegeria sp. TaxID=259304 RepID=UPI00262F2A4E|nr:nucleotidyltransferase domain-containing protein [uncultured Ruegeria sp.]